MGSWPLSPPEYLEVRLVGRTPEELLGPPGSIIRPVVPFTPDLEDDVIDIRDWVPPDLDEARP
jgi:hypothetical protein